MMLQTPAQSIIEFTAHVIKISRKLEWAFAVIFAINLLKYMILQALHVAAGIRCDVRNNDVLPQKASLLKFFI